MSGRVAAKNRLGFWYLWGADHVFPRHRQRGDVHGDAAVHVERPDQEEAAPAHDGPAQNHSGSEHGTVRSHQVASKEKH